MARVPSSCALLGGFAMVNVFRCYGNIQPEREMSATVCTHSMPGCSIIRGAENAGRENTGLNLGEYVHLSVVFANFPVLFALSL